MTKQAKGACLCNNVQFVIALPPKWVAHCHCSMCRRAHGAAFVTWLGVEENLLQIEKGLEEIHWHHSSEDAQRGFCNHCGSSLFFKSKKWTGEVHIALANMIEDIGQQPKLHAFYNTHVEWSAVNDELPKIHENGTAIEIKEKSVK